MKIRDLLEAASIGSTNTGGVATLANPGGKNPKEVGTLFGGTYGETINNKPKKKTKVVKR